MLRLGILSRLSLRTPPVLAVLPPQVPERTRANRVAKRRDNVMEKYLRSQEKKNKMKRIDVWPSMSVTDLSRVLKAPLNDLFDLILCLPEAAKLEDERQPIRNRDLFLAIAQKLSLKIHFVADPAARTVKLLQENTEEEENLDVVVTPPNPANLRPRPPVVAIMGHVDHGKTTLLDYLRHSRIVDKEFGGITQHIGAFSVQLEEEKGRVTFIDTPGHAAFKAMRSRGAQCTDIVVLVVDAAEGVKEQTRESLRMIREAKTPMIVAINKIDRPGADIDKTKKDLQASGVELEDFGGQVQCVAISALTGTNVNTLVEALSALAEVLQVSADYEGPVEGIVIESTVHHGLGKMATVLVQRGRLKVGDILVCGHCYAKVRQVHDDHGQSVTEAKPSEAVTVAGWRKLPSAGDQIYQVPNERRAKQVVAWREKKATKQRNVEASRVIEHQRKVHKEDYHDYRMKKLEAGVLKPRFGWHDFHVRHRETNEYTGPPKLSLVIKADVDGSLEAILNCLDTYHEEDVVFDLVDFGVGTVTEHDLTLAQDFNAIIYAFNLSVSTQTTRGASDLSVPLKQFNVIYHMVEDLKQEINHRLPVKSVQHVIGRAEVLREFVVNEKRRKVPVAGCKVTQGRLERQRLVQVLRKNEVLYDGELESLKHLKNEVGVIELGRECGLTLEDPEVRFQEGDVIVSYENKLEKQQTEWSPGF